MGSEMCIRDSVGLVRCFPERFHAAGGPTDSQPAHALDLDRNPNALVFFNRSMPLWTKEGIYITLFALPLIRPSSSRVVLRCAASVSNTRINALSVTPVRRKAPGPCRSVPVAQNRISGGVAQKLLYANQHLCQCHSAGSSKHSSQHRYRSRCPPPLTTTTQPPPQGKPSND